MKENRKNILTITTIFLFISFLLLAISVAKGLTLNLDNYIYDLIIQNSFLTKLMKTITFFGETITLSSLAIILFIIIKNKHLSLLIPINLAIIGLANFIIKMIIARPRPEDKLIEASGFSFPSGHTASSLAFYGFLIYLIYKKCNNKKLKITIITILTGLIILIGFSRIYLHVHYATDVIGSILYSLGYLLIYIRLSDRFIINKSIKKEGILWK